MKDYSLDFPLLERRYQSQSLIYFDNAATSLKPRPVIEAVFNYYNFHNANIHRGPNFLAEEATNLYEEARSGVAEFINAETEEIIFTSSATASLNLVARSWAETNLKKNDVVVITRAEHHANIVPWLQLKERLGIIIKYIDLDKDGNLYLDNLDALLEEANVRLLSITQVSNVLGIFNELKPILTKARQHNIISIVDASQGVAHQKLDVKYLGADFLVFSGHKLFAPSGVGVLYGRREILEAMPPFFGGGGMISEVKDQSFVSAELPFKFEAGTPNIEGVIGLGAACQYLKKIGWEAINKKEEALTDYFLECLKKNPSLKLLGTVSNNRLPLFTLVIKDIHPHDAADLLGEQGIIVRAGHHCAQPLHDYLGEKFSLRASLSFYNTNLEIDRFFKTLKEIQESFK